MVVVPERRAAAVNAGFPESTAASEPFFVRCTDTNLAAGPPPSGSEPGVTYPQPGSPTTVSPLVITSVYRPDAVRVQFTVVGTTPGSGVLTAVRICRNARTNREQCSFDDPPPGTTTSGGRLERDYVISGLPPVGSVDALTFQMCNDAGCGIAYELELWAHHSSPNADFHVLVNPFINDTQVAIYVLDPETRSVTVEYSDGTTWTANCTSAGPCGEADKDSDTLAESVTITAERSGPQEAGSVTIQLR